MKIKANLLIMHRCLLSQLIIFMRIKVFFLNQDTERERTSHIKKIINYVVFLITNAFLAMSNKWVTSILVKMNCKLVIFSFVYSETCVINLITFSLCSFKIVSNYRAIINNKYFAFLLLWFLRASQKRNEFLITFLKTFLLDIC